MEIASRLESSPAYTRTHAYSHSLTRSIYVHTHTNIDAWLHTYVYTNIDAWLHTYVYVIRAARAPRECAREFNEDL